MIVVTTKQHRYAGKLHKVGEEYEIVGKSGLRLLRALGWADLALPKISAPIAVIAPVRSKGKDVVDIAVFDLPIALEVAPQDDAQEVDDVELEPEVVASTVEVAAETEDATKTKRAYKRRDLSA